uniref:Uncharacterized protein n=1 Tax=Oryza rufipogon TaxID=4529 RepID=A0A0E0Q6I2_ORYRU
MVVPECQGCNKGEKRGGASIRSSSPRKYGESGIVAKEELSLQQIIERITDEIWLWPAAGAKGIKCLIPNTQDAINSL